MLVVSVSKQNSFCELAFLIISLSSFSEETRLYLCPTLSIVVLGVAGLLSSAPEKRVPWTGPAGVPENNDSVFCGSVFNVSFLLFQTRSWQLLF